MKRNHARLILALSVFLLSFVGLDLVSLSKNFTENNTRAPKEKVDLVQEVNDLGKVLGGCTPCFEFYLKDSVDSSFISGATATLVTRDVFDFPYWDFSEFCKDLGCIYSLDTLGNGGTLKPGQTTPATVMISITKVGYDVKTTTINSGYSNVDTVYLTKSASNTTPTIKKTTTTSKTMVKVETIKDITLPAGFKAAGTQTTDLSTVVDSTKVSDLKLDSANNTIKFNEAVDLSSSDTKDKFKTLDNYVKVDKVGIVSIDSTNLPALNKKATITMKNLSFVKQPKVLVNGKVDSSVVSNIHYVKGTLTFDVTHFSTFTIAPTVGINEPADRLETKDNPITLRGSVSNPTASVSAKLNNRDLGKLKVATASGIFEKQVTLSEGTNKIVVTAFATNGITAVASVSATLLKAVVDTNMMVYYLIIALLAFIAAIGIIFAVRALKNHHQPKKPGSGTPESTKSASPPVVKVEPVQPSINPNSTNSVPWESTPTPKFS